LLSLASAILVHLNLRSGCGEKSVGLHEQIPSERLHFRRGINLLKIIDENTV
jgi:hypothetical protein